MSPSLNIPQTATSGASSSTSAKRVLALELRSVAKRFGTTVALEQADLAVVSGEFLTLLGPSGSGKTTLLRIIVGFESPTSGQVLLRGRDISRMSPAQRDVGMVFQHYALFPHMTVADNVGYGLKLRGWRQRRRRERVQEVLELVRLGDYGNRYPRQLSGGQQQRVALGRALAYDPEIILMDEPLGALDRALRIEMEEELRRIHRDLKTTIVYVTHDQQEALALSDRIAIMRDGRIEAIGTPEELYYRPPTTFVASFFAGSNLLAVDSAQAQPNGEVRVQVAGQEVTCRCIDGGSRDMALVVRRHSLRRVASEPSLRLAGVVDETLLFGDQREVSVHVSGLGRVVALLDARDSHDLGIGAAVELHAPISELLVIPANVLSPVLGLDATEPVASEPKGKREA